MIRIQRAGDRYPGGDPGAGVETRHALSFGPHYDPDNLRFGPLLAVNEERLAPGAGFDEHPHSHTEIVTWVVEGELTHRDTAGHETVVRPGDLQHLSSAAGVRHVERNAGDAPLTFVQMWLAPRETGGEPSYTLVRDLSGPYALPAAGAALHVHRPGRGDEVVLPGADTVYVHVVRGTVTLAGRELGEGDAARITDGDAPSLTAAEPAELLVWESPA
ncbi:pirin family protein [Streptomyces sp. NPDC002262]|uniref:pirin family protein n=1 Tax=Streptomyces sp. NPDC002262 TaxID=3154414 RepID=UPI0033306CD9